MKYSRHLTALTLMIGLGWTAPAAAASKEQLQMMADIRMLQEQAQQLQLLIGALNESLKAVNSRLDQHLKPTGGPSPSRSWEATT